MSDLLAPTEEGAIVAAIRRAGTAHEPLAVAGNGTKSAMLRPVQAARSLSTRNLAGITLYSPTELIIGARAGTLLSEIEAAVTERGQHIIADTASALAGRRRLVAWLPATCQARAAWRGARCVITYSAFAR